MGTDAVVCTSRDALRQRRTYEPASCLGSCNSVDCPNFAFERRDDPAGALLRRARRGFAPSAGELARELPHVPEGAVSLGMLDIDAGVDEDYFVVGRPGTGPGLAVHGVAQRPTAWVARHLRRQGALVSSGIMRAYAGTLAEHIAKHWPQTSQELTALVAMKGADQAECEIPHLIQRRMPVAVMNSLRWHPPAFPQRVLTVCESEWSGLRSSHAVARIAECVENLTPWRLPPLTRPIIPYRRESVAS